MQTPPPNTELTRRLHSAHATRPQRVNGALEDHTMLPQRTVNRAVQGPIRDVVFGHVQNNRRHMAF